MSASWSWEWARVHCSCTLEPLCVNTSRGPSIPRLGTEQGWAIVRDLYKKWSKFTQHSELHEHAELLSHADLTLVSPAVSRPHGAEKIMSEYFCSYVSWELEDNSRQNYQVSAKFSKILFCSVLFELFANGTQNLQTASFVVELYLFLFQQYLLSVKFLIVSTTFY